MTEKWLQKDKLCTFDEKVRVELGPQIIELDCTAENLRDEITAPHYKIGKIDAYGKIIGYDTFISEDLDDDGEPTGNMSNSMKLQAARKGSINMGEKMFCVDWRSKHKPYIWKVYKLQKTDDMERFIKVDEYVDLNEALAKAKELRAGMG